MYQSNGKRKVWREKGNVCDPSPRKIPSVWWCLMCRRLQAVITCKGYVTKHTKYYFILHYVELSNIYWLCTKGPIISNWREWECPQIKVCTSISLSFLTESARVQNQNNKKCVTVKLIMVLTIYQVNVLVPVLTFFVFSKWNSSNNHKSHGCVGHLFMKAFIRLVFGNKTNEIHLYEIHHFIWIDLAVN